MNRFFYFSDDSAFVEVPEKQITVVKTFSLSLIKKMRKGDCVKLLYVLAFVLGFCGSVSGQTNTEENRKKFAMLEWLTGEWKRTDMKPGRSGSEVWKKISDRELRGIGVTIKGNDTVAVERMRLIDADSALYFAADVPENKRIVYFRLLSVSDSGFICENPSHDFPKTIEYRIRKGGMRATISGNGRSVEYLFVRHR